MNWIKGPISMGISYACYEVIERCFGVSKLENWCVCLAAEGCFVTIHNTTVV